MTLFGKPDVEKMKAKRDVKGLIATLRRAGNSSIQSAAGTALVDVGPIDDPSTVKSLLAAALDDPDADVREIAGVALHQVRDPRAVEPLIGALMNRNQFWFLRKRMAATLGEIGDPRAVEPLISVLQEKDQDGSEGEVRRYAAYALARIDSARAVEPIVAALKDENALMRMDAWRALATIGSPAIDALIRALNDPHEVERPVWVGSLDRGHEELRTDSVRFWAAKALGDIGDPRSVEPLVLALGDKLEMVRQAARLALIRIGAPSIQSLIRVLSSPERVPAEEAAEALARIYQRGELASISTDGVLGGNRGGLGFH